MRIKALVKENYLLLLILILAAALRIYNLNFQSLWMDEVLSLNDANPKLSWPEFYDSVLKWEAFPHLYFAMLKIFLNIFGFNAYAARFLSVIIGFLGVWSMYLFGKELFNKNVGLTAALFTAINSYHLYQSQEARPYGLLFLLTVVAFYRLVIFIRNPKIYNAILYGIFAGLMVHAHFFALIALLAQMFLLLFVLIVSAKSSRGKFFFRSLIAAVVALLLMIPLYKPFMNTLGIKAFWVAPPTDDSFTVMFREFFGNSEFVIFIAQFAILFYLFKIFQKENSRTYKFSVAKDKDLLGFLLMFFWLVIMIIVPLAKSFTDVSIILIRYFVSLLALILLVIAVGMNMIKNQVAKVAVVSSFLLFGLFNLFVAKPYYTTVTKTQLREIAADVISKNPNNVKVVSMYFWVIQPFFNETGKTVRGGTFESYINDLRNNWAEREEFWYVDFNYRPFALSEADQAFLRENYIQKEQLEYFDAWAKHYVPISPAAPPTK